MATGLTSGLSVSQGLALAAGSSLQAKGAYLAAKSGLCGSVALAWVTKENGVGNNVLGVGYSNGHLPTFPTWQAGLDAAVAAVQSSSYYAGIRAAIASGDCCKQRDAIIDSPWSGDFYGAKLPGGPRFPGVSGCGPYAGRWAQPVGNRPVPQPGAPTLPPTSTGPDTGNGALVRQLFTPYLGQSWLAANAAIGQAQPQVGTQGGDSWAHGLQLASQALAAIPIKTNELITAASLGQVVQYVNGNLSPADPLTALADMLQALPATLAGLGVDLAVLALILVLGYKGLMMILEG